MFLVTAKVNLTLDFRSPVMDDELQIYLILDSEALFLHGVLTLSVCNVLKHYPAEKYLVNLNASSTGNDLA